MTKKKLCPRCHGIGLIETAIGGHWCRECRGKGYVPDAPSTKVVDPAEKTRSAPAQEQENGEK
jgi:DnaJ-class molecular chaperone